MYASRWLTDEAAGRSYLSILEGLSDVAGQATLSLHWHHWQHEIAWMSLYFSVAVWFSIALVHAPSLQRVPHPSPQRSRPWHLLVGSRVAGQ
jgi:hypothetical protein